MLLLPIFIPILGGIALHFVAEKHIKALCNLIVLLTASLVLVLPFLQLDLLIVGKFPFDVIFKLQLDEVSLFFSWIFILVWWVVLQYSYEYFHHDSGLTVFYAYYLMVLGCMVGLSYAGNLVTLYVFFEFLGLLCIPLIAHSRSEEALKAARKYLYYSVAGAFMGLTSIFYFFTLEVPQVFQAGGISELTDQGDVGLVLIFTLLAVVGFGCKAGMFPLHGWLKTAHPIAPAPASAVLSAVTTKAGVLAILRLLYYVVGVEVLTGTFVQFYGIVLSLLTIFMGSMLAYREKVLKTRLAYSTISQVSYVLFALFLFQGYALVGAMLQVLCHALAKTLLFLSAGTMIHHTGQDKVKDFAGCGGISGTISLFTVASFSLVGLPLTGGFVSKWYIGLGGMDSAEMGILGVAVIMLSALLTAGYLLPISYEAFFPKEEVTALKTGEKDLNTPKILAYLLIIVGIFPMPVILFLFDWVSTLGFGGML